MTVYTTENCMQCKFLKEKLMNNGISFTVCMDVDVMQEKKIKNVPMLELDDGTMLNFQTVLKEIDKGTLYDR